MNHRAYKRYGEDLADFSRYQPTDRTPDTRTDHKGFCVCGTETTRYKTVGPPGHHGNGWQCRDCSESEMRAIFDRAMRKDV